MKFNIGTLIQVDTSDKYTPIKLSDGMVTGFFIIVGLLHVIQTIRYPTSFWVTYHSTCAFLAFYWPYMISTGLTHPGLGHASYGLLAMIPHITPIQTFGILITMDKVYNLDGVRFNQDTTLFMRNNVPLNTYGVDNLFVDNWLKPQGVRGLVVNIFFIALMSALEVGYNYIPAAWKSKLYLALFVPWYYVILFGLSIYSGIGVFWGITKGTT